METLIVARHGESVFSVAGNINGDPFVPGALTPDGVEQARRLGDALRGDAIDLCVITEFERTRQTADIALEGRDVPRVVVPELNDIRVGAAYEGGPFDRYVEWARAATPLDVPEGGESRAGVAARVASGYRKVLARAEDTVLVVAHGLPIRYLLLTVAGEAPRPVLDRVDYATPYRLTRSEVEEAVTDLENWCREPAWRGTG